MKVFALAVAAAMPLVAASDEGPLPPAPPPCHVGIDLQVHAALPWGPLEWTVFTSDVDRIRAQYGVTFCWALADEPCGGVRVHLRVLVEDASARRSL